MLQCRYRCHECQLKTGNPCTETNRCETCIDYPASWFRDVVSKNKYKDRPKAHSKLSTMQSSSESTRHSRSKSRFTKDELESKLDNITDSLFQGDSYGTSYGPKILPHDKKIASVAAIGTRAQSPLACPAYTPSEQDNQTVHQARVPGDMSSAGEVVGRGLVAKNGTRHGTSNDQEKDHIGKEHKDRGPSKSIRESGSGLDELDRHPSEASDISHKKKKGSGKHKHRKSDSGNRGTGSDANKENRDSPQGKGSGSGKHGSPRKKRNSGSGMEHTSGSGSGTHKKDRESSSNRDTGSDKLEPPYLGETSGSGKESTSGSGILKKDREPSLLREPDPDTQGRPRDSSTGTKTGSGIHRERLAEPSSEPKRKNTGTDGSEGIKRDVLKKRVYCPLT
jgi:hypothetical protein